MAWPVFAISLFSSASRCSRRAAAITRAPSAANNRATARPTPLDAPRTSTTLSRRETGILSNYTLALFGEGIYNDEHFAQRYWAVAARVGCGGRRAAKGCGLAVKSL